MSRFVESTTAQRRIPVGTMSQSRQHAIDRKTADAVAGRLRTAGLKLTRPRMIIGALLFGPCHRHVTAEKLRAEARQQGYAFPLATIYNTLNRLTAHGFLRMVANPGGPIHFDTDTSAHPHFHLADEGRIIDIPPGALCFSRMPEAPAGMRIVDIEVIVRLARA